VRESVQALEECAPLVGGERVERRPERVVTGFEPRADLFRRERVEVDHGAPPVVDVLAAADEHVVVEVAGELARGGQAEVEVGGELADRLRPVGADMGQQRQVARGQVQVRAQLDAGLPAPPETAHDRLEQAAELAEVVVSLRGAYHLIKVTD